MIHPMIRRMIVAFGLVSVLATACTASVDSDPNHCACAEECGADIPGPPSPEVAACVSTCAADCADRK